MLEEVLERRQWQRVRGDGGQRRRFSFGVDPHGQRAVEAAYSIRFVDDEEPCATVLLIEGPDAKGLLNAIATSLSDHVKVVSFGGKTLPSGAVRDRFVVQTHAGTPLSADARVPLTRQLHDSLRRLMASRPGDAFYNVAQDAIAAAQVAETGAGVLVAGATMPLLPPEVTHASSF